MNSQNKAEFIRFQKELQKLGADLNASTRRVINNISDIGMKETLKTTPVGHYKNGKEGGTLRGAWKKIAPYQNKNGWSSGYTNNTYYGIYVNNGHRILNKKKKEIGFVKEVEMLEKGTFLAKRSMNNIFNSEIARIKSKGGW